jgi:penicillin-binding protein 2
MFNDQLQGKVGQLNISFDASGKKASEQILLPPQPGYNVVTTLDVNFQRLCEDALAKGCKRGAMVMTDANTGDILALASWPPINPNWFVPTISQADFDSLRNDPNNPLIPRAFRSAYPPGSVFKVFVGLAAMQTGKVGPDYEFSCPTSLEIGNLTFRNWKKEHAGDLNFVDALTQSCNTYFYQVGLRIGAAPIVDYSLRLGLGARTGIPLASETNGRIPTEEYMQKVYKRRFMPGDIANLSIGQGDTLVSPLQMAQAMTAIANGGTLYQMRLVQQVQALDNQIVTAYDVRARAQIDIDKRVMSAIRKAMVNVVSSGMGTAGRASVDGVQVAGKTGTAQWGPKNNERTAAWFAGFVPANEPRYAFAVVYEGEANNDDVHGGTQAAPIVGRVLKEIYKEEKKAKKGSRKKPAADEKPKEERASDGTPIRRAEPVMPEEE